MRKKKQNSELDSWKRSILAIFDWQANIMRIMHRRGHSIHEISVTIGLPEGLIEETLYAWEF